MPDRWQLDPSAPIESSGPTAATLEALSAERTLDERDAPTGPFELFGRWLEEAYAAAIPWPHVTVLATSTLDGVPSARTVTLERFDPSGFVFHTYLDSPKGQDIAQNPRAALVFLWRTLGRQVRIAGDVVPASRAETEAYCWAEPRGIQVMLTACENQSAVVESRSALEAAYARALARYPSNPLPIPSSWGGLRVVPAMLEFFQARANNLQDPALHSRRPFVAHGATGTLKRVRRSQHRTWPR
jgi:pyridoxamine 5'-phosphate oxidase